MNFPLLYHAHHGLYQEDLPFWLGLAARHGGPVLELGCGTGRVLLALAQSGYVVCGVDNDPGMLEVLQANLSPELKGRVSIVLADFVHIQLGQTFNLVILPCNTYSTLTDEQRQATLQSVHRHLGAGGLFAVSLPNPELLRAMPRRGAPEIEEVFPHPLDGEPVQVSSSWQRSRQEFVVRWHYDHLSPNGDVQRHIQEVRHQLVAVQTYQDEFRQAGFSRLTLSGDFDGSPFEAESPQLIFQAQI